MAKDDTSRVRQIVRFRYTVLVAKWPKWPRKTLAVSGMWLTKRSGTVGS